MDEPLGDEADNEEDQSLLSMEDSDLGENLAFMISDI